MDKWLVNMVAGAILASLLVLFGTNTFINIIYPSGGEPEAPSEHAAMTEGGAAGGAPSKAAPEVPLATLLHQASADAGAKQAKKCAACHTFDEGGANKIGPNLHGIVGRPVASHEGFAYSPALKEFGGTWDYEKLNCFIAKPRDCVSGTKMSFAGIKKDSDRADVIAYLRSISPDAPPLPEESKAASAPAAEDGASTAASKGAAKKASASDGQASAATGQAATQQSATPAEQLGAASNQGEAKAAADTTAPANSPDAASTVPAQN